ncbi:WSC domain-containing protein, partial [Friedmanniomyces simplex]
VLLLNGRWYPTAMTMANGSILVMGGEKGSNGAAVPTLEVLPSPSGEVLYCDYLARTDPYNLYPYLAVLPSGGIFVAYYNEARILDPVSLQTTQVLPKIPGAVNYFDGGRTYPMEGTSMVLPQHAPYDEYMRVLICGGSTPGPEIALDNCVSIAPDEPNANWTIERMPSQRVMSSMTALPDGTYLILNGAHQGFAGFGLATSPNLNAVLYDPTKPVNHRMSVMANTTVARLYHSEAVLLDDGRVLVSGSDPEDVRAFAPQEYRNEVFIPPYLMSNPQRPAMNVTNLDWSYGESITFTITPSDAEPANNLTRRTTWLYRVSLVGAVSSTHGNSMGQRAYFPETSCSGNTCTVTAPPNANVCPPSWFQMFLLDENNVPSHATWVRVGGDPAQLGDWPDFPDFDRPGMGAVEAIL